MFIQTKRKDDKQDYKKIVKKALACGGKINELYIYELICQNNGISQEALTRLQKGIKCPKVLRKLLVYLWKADFIYTNYDEGALLSGICDNKESFYRLQTIKKQGLCPREWSLIGHIKSSVNASLEKKIVEKIALKGLEIKNNENFEDFWLSEQDSQHFNFYRSGKRIWNGSDELKIKYENQRREKEEENKFIKSKLDGIGERGNPIRYFTMPTDYVFFPIKDLSLDGAWWLDRVDDPGKKVSHKYLRTYPKALPFSADEGNFPTERVRGLLKKFGMRKNLEEMTYWCTVLSSKRLENTSIEKFVRAKYDEYRSKYPVRKNLEMADMKIYYLFYEGYSKLELLNIRN